MGLWSWLQLLVIQDKDVTQFDMVLNFLKAKEFLSELLQLQS